MRVTQIIANLRVDDIDTARAFYTEIVHPLTEEPWGIRRLFVRAPDGTVINIAGHRDE